MGIFDGILGNLDDLAAKVGLPADQVKSLTESLQSKLADGGNSSEAIAATAAENGLSADKLQEVLDRLGGSDLLEKLGLSGQGAGGALGQVAGFLDKDGDGSPLNDLTNMAKGLFNKN